MTGRRKVRVTPRFLDGATMFRDAMQQNALRPVRRGTFQIGYVHVWSYAGQAYQDLLDRTAVWRSAQGRRRTGARPARRLGGASPAYLNLFNRDIPQLVMKKPRTRGIDRARPAMATASGAADQRAGAQRQGGVRLGIQTERTAAR